uniref:Seven TM Receptor n=2 Tax=Caenorhabditis japonica TaxID=281687 RepID=A0A8R1HY27_CAEJA
MVFKISATYCACYSMSFSLFAVHFVYRYFTACKPENLRLFRGLKFFSWLLGALFAAVSWGMATFLLFPETDRTKRSLIHVLKESYDLDPLWIGNVPYSYRRTDENGIEHPDIPNILGILQHGVIMALSFSTVFYCGMQTHKKIKSHKGVSDRTRELQNQLFNALVLQTIIPTILMYIPTTTIIVLPFLGINVGSYSNITTVTVQMYPAFDPLVLLFLIKDIREAFFKTVCLGRDTKRKACTPTMLSFKLKHVMI